MRAGEATTGEASWQTHLLGFVHSDKQRARRQESLCWHLRSNNLRRSLATALYATVMEWHWWIILWAVRTLGVGVHFTPRKTSSHNRY